MPFDPLYSENVGLGGFRCRDCARVTRTYRGMKTHLWRVHGIKIQTEFGDWRKPKPDEVIPEHLSGAIVNEHDYISGTCKCHGHARDFIEALTRDS